MPTTPAPTRSAQFHQRPVARPVAEDVVVLQLDEDIVAAEPVDEPSERLLRLGRAAGLHELRDASLAAAAQHDHALGVALELFNRDAGVEPARLLALVALLVEPEGDAGEMAEVGVAALRLRQQRQVRARLALVRLLDGGELQPRDRPQPRLLRGAGELHRPVQAVVIGERERAMALRLRRPHQLVDARRALQQRVVGVQVQLDVRRVVEHFERHGVERIARRERARRIRCALRLHRRAARLPLVPAPHVAGPVAAPLPSRHGPAPVPECGLMYTN